MCLLFAAQPMAQVKPNILFILADDLGYSDLSSYGGEIPTPNIDALAESGIRFSRFYVSPMCVTTRAAFLSGMEYMAAGGGSFPKGVSLAHVLRQAGYQTSMVGKNHGMNNFRIGNAQTDYGFDHFYGFSGGQINSFTGAGNVEWQSDGKIFPHTQLPADFYATKNFTDHAINFMKKSLAAGKPFFSYVAYNAPHSPLDAPERNVRKFYDPQKGVDVYAEGWEKLREKRLARQKAMGLFPAGVKLPETGPEIPDWNLLPQTSNQPWVLQKDFESLTRSAYAGMVDNMDENVGRLIAFLRDPNNDGNTDDSQLENTLIVFASDNGGCYAGVYTARNALPWKSGGFTTDYGWGSLSNTPFRYYKHASHEGGIRAPLVIHWPKGITVNRGSILSQMVRVWDFYPTFLGLAGATYPKTHGGKNVKPLMGKSLQPLFTNAGFKTEEYFVSVYNRSRGIIKDGWKIANYGDGPFELFNLENDPTETKDLAKEHPAILADYRRMWESYAALHGFTNNRVWNAPMGEKKRGWGYDMIRDGIKNTVPEYMAEGVAVGVKLAFTFIGKIDFSNTDGKEIRLQKYGEPGIIWSASPDTKSPYQGKTSIVFENFPALDSSSHYYITWDAGWVKYEENGAFLNILPVREDAYAFRFKTAGSKPSLRVLPDVFPGGNAGVFSVLRRADRAFGIQFDFPRATQGQYSVYALTGKLIGTAGIKGKNGAIAFSELRGAQHGLARGVYLGRFTGQDGQTLEHSIPIF